MEQYILDVSYKWSHIQPLCLAFTWYTVFKVHPYHALYKYACGFHGFLLLSQYYIMGIVPHPHLLNCLLVRLHRSRLFQAHVGGHRGCPPLPWWQCRSEDAHVCHRRLPESVNGGNTESQDIWLLKLLNSCGQATIIDLFIYNYGSILNI